MRSFHKWIVVDPALIKMADARQKPRIAVAPAAEGVACADAEGDEQGAPEAKAEDADGDFPLMTESGTFVINGAERVVVSQIVRSPASTTARRST